VWMNCGLGAREVPILRARHSPALTWAMCKRPFRGPRDRLRQAD
jgi:hypothetical protein